MKLKYRVLNNNYYNIKQILKEEFHISDRLIVKLKAQQKIFLNDIYSSINTPIKLNDTIEVDLDYEEDNLNILPTKINLSILYEDDALLALDKPPHMPIHPSMEHYTDSLSNGVRYYFDEIGLKKKIRPINRLDKDTSGVTIFAKNEYVQEALSKQMQNGKFEKEYFAIINGYLKQKVGTINLPIARKENSIIERCVNENGDIAITHYKVLYEFNNLSFLQIKIDTGRTHQIRVHFSHIGHPILGDTLYGSKSSLITRQALHAYQIHFIHPITKNDVVVKAKLPEDFIRIIPYKNLETC